VGLGGAWSPNDIWCIFGAKMIYLARPSMQLGDLGERCKLPQRVWAKPGRQMTFGAFLVGKRFIWKGPR